MRTLPQKDLKVVAEKVFRKELHADVVYDATVLP